MREETEEQFSNEIGERVMNLAEEVLNERRERYNFYNIFLKRSCMLRINTSFWRVSLLNLRDSNKRKKK